MKKTLYIYFSIAAFAVAQELPFTRGVNITNWFQANSVKQIQFTKYIYQDFAELKSLGVDVVRLPINLHFMTNGAPDYAIDPLLYFFLDQVVDWSEELGINLILDNHTFDVNINTPTDIDEVLIPVWTQMAGHYKDRSELIYYEILNEPHGINDERWNEIQQAVITAIRDIDQKHTIVIGPAGWNSYNNLSAMPQYTDDKLIYTFHFYDPFIFTHQGASWTDPSMESLAGVPFPYNAAKMPECPPDLIGTWIQNELNGYQSNGTIQKVRDLIDIAIEFKNERNAVLLCGELGVFIPNSPVNDRILWYNIVRTYLEQNNIAWTMWDYRGAFGLFEKNSSELFDYDLNINLVNALGFNAPPQYEFVIQPDSTWLGLYSDFIEKNIYESGWTNGIIDFYNESNPEEGIFCIYWTGAKQYDQIGFDFRPNKDLSRLFSEDYLLDFWIKGNNQSTSIDIRFLDTKTEDPNDHPWRMKYTLNNLVVNFNNEWHHLQIPLSDFEEQGSWDNGWYNPIGAFDWKAIDKFEIVAENHGFTNHQLWFDEIKIYNPDISRIEDEASLPLAFKLEQNYPNPFNSSTNIIYSLPKSCYISIKVFDVLGREIAAPVEGYKNAGTYNIEFPAKNNSLPSGIYFYQIRTGEYSGVKKMILLK